MGGYGSGHHQTRKLCIEEVQRIEAWSLSPEIIVTLCTGGSYKLGTCPKCGRNCKHLYETPTAQEWACRQCHNLTYALNATRHRRAANLVHDPREIEKGLKSAAQFIETKSAPAWGKAMGIIEAATETAKICLHGDRRGDNAELPEDIQERITDDDIAKATAMMHAIEAQLNDAEENHVSREGNFSRVPLRVDSLAKLGHLWVTLANLRATRAGIATEIRQNRIEGKLTSADLLREQVRAVLLEKPSYDSPAELTAPAEFQTD